MLGWDKLIEPITGLIGEFVEDKDKTNELAFKLKTLAETHAAELAKGQMTINQTEATHRSIFVAGWRPFVGWVCGVSLAWHMVCAPILQFTFPDMEFPEFDAETLKGILMGMLGLGVARTFEKLKGVAK